MGRAPCCDKANVKRGPWSPEEDTALRNYLERHGTGGNWIALPQKAGLKRCGKSCRLRWLNYLRPDIKHGGFTQEEDDIICSLYVNIGSRWSIIAAKLPGRTDNDVKNYWNTKLKKKFLAGKISSSSTSTTTTTTTSSSAYSPHLQPIKSETTTDNYGFSNSLNHNSSSTLHLPMNITDPIHNVSSPYYHQEVTGLQPAPLIQSSIHPFGNSNENSYNLWSGNEDDGFFMEHGFNSAAAYSYDFLHDFGFHDQEKTIGEVGSTVAAADLGSNSPLSTTTMLYANFLANTTCDTKLQGFYQSVTN